MGSPALQRQFDVDTGKKAPGTFQLQKMRAKHRRIAEDVAVGMSDREVAKRHKVSPQTVANTRKSPVVMAYLGIVEGAIAAERLGVAREMDEISPFAVRTLEVLMLDRNVDDRLRAKIAHDFLDRTGHTPVKKMAIAHASITDDDLADINRRAGIVDVDAEVKEDLNGVDNPTD